MRRREFITLVGGAAAASSRLAARAEQGERARRIGVLQGLSESDPEWSRRFGAFKQRLQELGWTEGRNVVFEFRFAGGKPERLPALAAELIHSAVDVILTNASQPIEAARKATSTIPIVMASVGDALGAGYVASLARPGGNVTGLTLVATDQSAKRLQLLKEIVPNLGRVAVLWNGNASGHRLQLQEIERATPTLGIVLLSFPIRTADDIQGSLQVAMQANAQALVTMDDPVVQSQRGPIVAFAMAHGLPVMSEFRPATEAGTLMSYGPNQIDLWRRSAIYVDKILRGANPADLPVEQPTKFELVINLKTAKALGLTIPPSVLAIADEVIE
jgi:putative tryptophan/tyrosine transport system substrate-binding protein